MSDVSGSADGGQPGGEGAVGVEGSTWFAPEGLAPEIATQLGDVVKAKGWKTPADALLSYVNLEKVYGADKAGRTILAPKDAQDAEGWNAVYDRLGRPETPDGYKIPLPEGDDGEFLKSATPAFHAAGLSQQQAESLATWWNDTQAQAQQQFVTQSEADYGALKQEWGQAAPQNEELARRAVAQFGQQAGLDADGLGALERAIGTGPMLKLFHAIGSKFAEGTFVAGEQSGGGAMTPAAAQAAIVAKFSDREFMQRYTHESATIRQPAIDEMLRLQMAANPELAA